MSKIINGVASGYDIPISEEVQLLSRWVDPTIEQLQQENKQLKEINEEHKKLNGELREENKKQKEVIDKAIEYIKHYETIRGYYEYQECGYDEYNYEEDLKEELLDILKEVE